jgi:hypothetical protein
MLSIGTHSASTWGYNLVEHYKDTKDGTQTGQALITEVISSYANLGLFTKPTLAPNGAMYSILTGGSLTIDGVVREFVIRKIIPGTTNARWRDNNNNLQTSNWQKATRSYIVADNSIPEDANRFARPSWSSNNSASAIRFHPGILASNGLIYFAPFIGGTPAYWVIFNPETDTWKLDNSLKASTDASLSAGHITGLALGTDNHIYVIGNYKSGNFASTSNTRSFRIVTSPFANSDLVENSFFTKANVSFMFQPYFNPSTGGTSGGADQPGSWVDASGNISYDTANLDGVTHPYAVPGSNYQDFDIQVRDMITHPSGKIFIIPGRGRGRIFYIDQSQFGLSLREMSSAPGLTTNVISGYGYKTLEGLYAFLEKPRGAGHALETLKIYIVPAIGHPSNQLQGPLLLNNRVQDVLVIDPVTMTMSVLDMGFANLANNVSVDSSVGRRVTLPNGMTLTPNKFGGTPASVRQGGVILTGWDVPTSSTANSVNTSVTTGTRKIKPENSGLLFRADGKGFGLNPAATMADQNPAYITVGGGLNAKWPHHGKFLHMAAVDSTDKTNPNLLMELVSVKGYGPDITNFNFSARDKWVHELPDDLTYLGGSFFNCQYNKMK